MPLTNNAARCMGPWFASTAQDIEVISVPLNRVAYPGEILSTPSLLSRRFMLPDYSPDRALDVGPRCKAGAVRVRMNRFYATACSGEYEGTSHFLVAASSAKIGFLEVNLQPLKGEVP